MVEVAILSDHGEGMLSMATCLSHTQRTVSAGGCLVVVLNSVVEHCPLSHSILSNMQTDIEYEGEFWTLVFAPSSTTVG